VSYTPYVEGTLIKIADHGLIEFSDIYLTAEPMTYRGTERNAFNIFQDMSLTTNGIDYTKPANIAYLAEYNEEHGTEGASVTFEVDIALRSCVSGESFTANGAYTIIYIFCKINISCSECREDIEYLKDIPTEETDCLACPENALCLGGNKVGPEAGRWASDEEDTDYIKCYFSDACL
jgi:hypothetical protein